MIRALAALALLAAAAPAPPATGVRWTPLAEGTTAPSGAQDPVGYVAVNRAQEQRWLGRLEPADRAAVRRLNLVSTGAVAVFLDGMPCASHVAVTGLTRAGATLTVRVAFTRPPIGMATCVRTSTAYVVVGASRRTLGRPAPSHVTVLARARA